MGEQTSPPAGIRVGDPAERARKTRLLNILTISATVVCILFLALMYLPVVGSSWAYKLIFGLLLICCVLSYLVNRVGRVGPASLLYTLSLTLAIFAVILVGVLDYGIVGWAIYYFLVPVLVAGMVVGPRATFSFATLNVLLIAVITIVARHVASYDPADWPTNVLAVVIPAGMLCYVMAIVAWLYGSSLQDALRQVTEQSQQLQAANKEIRAFSRTLEEKVEERTHELREFVSMVAHDLRNPLTTIRGYTEMLLEEQADGQSKRQSRPVHMIAANVEHMLQLTGDLLEISRLRSGSVQFDMEVLPIQLVIEEVCASFEQRLNEKRLGLKVEVPPDLPPVWGDHHHLTQVLTNLMGNAYHYTPAGAIVVGARQVDGSVEVSVADTGIGIPAEEQKRLFTHFFRGEHEVVRSRKGTGLGLSISLTIVEAHGGQIWVDSEVDRGSTFHFTVPLASNSPAEAFDTEALPDRAGVVL